MRKYFYKESSRLLDFVVLHEKLVRCLYFENARERKKNKTQEMMMDD